MRKLILMLAAVVLVLVVPARARAGLVLWLYDPGTSTSLYVQDEGVGDAASGIPGVVQYSGAFGSWTLSATTGSSKDVIGPPPSTDLNSVNISGGAGSIWLALTDTDFIGYAGSRTITSEIGGTTNGTLTYFTAFDNGNAEFEDTVTTVNGATFGPGAFSQTFASAVTLGDPFSMTQWVNITHTARGQITSFDSLMKVPEPGTMTLLGLGFLTLAFRRRRASR
jgi:hypothetical protein